MRGFCCIKVGVKGVSETIQVQSTIGRFLEHSRIFYFRNGKADPVDGDFYIGSADWMYRNLHARVEALCPIYDRDLKEKLWTVLQLYWNDTKQTWKMKTDASYDKKVKVENSKNSKNELLPVQEELMKLSKLTAQTHEDSIKLELLKKANESQKI